MLPPATMLVDGLRMRPRSTTSALAPISSEPRCFETETLPDTSMTTLWAFTSNAGTSEDADNAPWRLNVPFSFIVALLTPLEIHTRCPDCVTVTFSATSTVAAERYRIPEMMHSVLRDPESQHSTLALSGATGCTTATRKGERTRLNWHTSEISEGIEQFDDIRPTMTTYGSRSARLCCSGGGKEHEDERLYHDV